ncbi:hypothetical protein EVAR_5741_1 [Eumeta japonica]|uniref:Uncharacterized protein n=1 Tax=Eumeta variegata TaxID=151549 RepID=A0A4C1T7P6_EUMVA|nr:hypothetical protein EVAR_5741_1 [Eumeta japonica]
MLISIKGARVYTILISSKTTIIFGPAPSGTQFAITGCARCAPGDAIGVVHTHTENRREVTVSADTFRRVIESSVGLLPSFTLQPSFTGPFPLYRPTTSYIRYSISTQEAGNAPMIAMTAYILVACIVVCPSIML